MTAVRTVAQKRAPELLFGLLLLIAGVVLAAAGSGLTFFHDEWEILLGRDGLSPDTLLDPHNGQVFVVPVLVYKGLIALFGISTQLPYRLVAIAVALLCAGLLFTHVRRSSGPWMATVLLLPVLFLGAGWEALLLPLSMNFLISLTAGLGMLLALDRGDRRGDIGAAMLLLLSLAASGLGLAFACGAVAEILIRRHPARAWIAAAPLALFGLWTLGYGGEASSTVGWENVRDAPRYVFDAASSVTGSLTGVAGAWQPVSSFAYRVDSLLLLLALAGVAARFFYAKSPVSRRAIAVGVVLLSFWTLAALATSLGREPDASRYQYPGVVLAVAFGGALLEGLRLPRFLPLMILPVALFSVMVNLTLLRQGRDWLSVQTQITRSSLGALAIEDSRALPALDVGVASGDPYLTGVDAGAYLEAISRHGSPGYSSQQIGAAIPEARRAAASVTATVERLSPTRRE